MIPYLKVLGFVLALFTWATLGAVVFMWLVPSHDPVSDELELRRERGLRVLMLIMGTLWPAVLLYVCLSPLFKKLGDPTLLPLILHKWLTWKWVLLKEKFQ